MQHGTLVYRDPAFVQEVPATNNDSISITLGKENKELVCEPADAIMIHSPSERDGSVAFQLCYRWHRKVVVLEEMGKFLPFSPKRITLEPIRNSPGLLFRLPSEYGDSVGQADVISNSRHRIKSPDWQQPQGFLPHQGQGLGRHS